MSPLSPDTIPQVAWLGDKYLRGPIRGVVLSFHGLGHACLKYDISPVDLGWAAAGGLVVFPYYGPWSWMNRPARAFVDDLVDAVYAKFNLSDRIPLISTGASMGGLSTLIYTRYARRPVTACHALFPVCDFKLHFTERPDLPPSIRHAFLGYPGTWDEFLTENSPLCQVDQMPKIPYQFIHGDQDAAVSKTIHSDPMVAAMRRRGLKVDYLEVPGMSHGNLIPLAVLENQINFVSSFLSRG